ncbi:UNC93-like protein [Colletotrichum orbiculare MAFF 240422]|uniref:UNC93-like protein n=1 Tax=Colletotrichum orbiculare (strain 104-T / ATCC 96160 / CBS 514.97 / LARS 414 / MAFF 240422) TaxID=1213857 RepID=A0A484G0C5_COLOR|nr:UNC93-like protein [Colletotrichum orbiculare MAFF 240422]
MSQVAGEKASFRERARNVYRGTIFQAVLLGLISFTQPGIWAAMNNLGAGGQAEPYVVNATNVITFVIMVFFSPLASIVGNLIGMKWIVVFGCIGYVPYSAALYCNSLWGTQWFLIFGAVTCGFSAAALWPGEAAIAVGYPEVARRGVCISIWMALGKLGSIIATAIQLALNKDGDTTGSISPSTYLVLVAIQCLGLPLALLLSPPEKLARRDGTKPTFADPRRSFKTQLGAFAAQFRRREVLLLIPAFVTAQWGVTYQGNYMAAYFTVRARTLSGFLIAVVGAGANLLSGWWLDTGHLRRTTPGEIDWSSAGFGEGVAIFILYRIAYETVGVWLYWTLGTFDVDADIIALSMGVLRSGESLGSALAYAVGSVRSASLMTNLIVSVVVFYAAVPATTWAALLVRDRLPGELSDGEEGVSGHSTAQQSDAEQVQIGHSVKV